MEDVLINTDYLHEFHRFTGDHSEIYWNAHLQSYMSWYVEVWRETAEEQ